MSRSAVASLAYDRGRKLKAYARSGVREYLTVNLRQDRIEVHRDPAETGYGQHRVASRGELLAFETFRDEPMPVGELLIATIAH